MPQNVNRNPWIAYSLFSKGTGFCVFWQWFTTNTNHACLPVGRDTDTFLPYSRRQNVDDKIPSNIRQPVPGFEIPDYRGATGCSPAGEFCAGNALLAGEPTHSKGYPEGENLVD